MIITSKKQINKYKNSECGSKPISNWATIDVYDVEFGIDDYVVWAYSYGEYFHKSKIRYTDDGPKFRARYTWYNLDDIINIDLWRENN